MDWIGTLIPAISIVAVFTFVAIAAWSDNRRRERESLYRHETYRKMLEQPGESVKAVENMMRQEEILREHKRVFGLKLAGMICIAAGIGTGIFLYFVELEEPIYLVALIPLLTGVVLVLSGRFMAPSTTAQGSGTRVP